MSRRGSATSASATATRRRGTSCAPPSISIRCSRMRSAAAGSAMCASHMTAMGRLFHRLARVARDNPLATRREGYSAERLSTISGDNRWICFPYPRLMNANAIIDQAAAVLMTSVGKAREWGIPQERWVFLHGCGEAPTPGSSPSAPRLDASPAIRGCERSARTWQARRAADVACLRSLQLLPVRGRDGNAGDRHRRGRYAADQRHRRPALLRWTRQQLRHPFDRRDDECRARASPASSAW